MAFAVSQAAVRSMAAPRVIQKIVGIGLNTFRESIRQPVFGIIMAVAFALIVLSPAYTMFTLMQSPKMIKDMGLATILVSGLLLAAFSAGNAIAEEIENRTVMTLLSKPVSRVEFILGKYLGVAMSLLLAGYVLSVVLLLTVAAGAFEAANQTVHLRIVLGMLVAGLLTVILAVFANYFMDRPFAPTAVLLAVPFFTVCLIVFMIWAPPVAIGKHPGKIDPQVALGCALILSALLVLGAVAVASSVRFGMVLNVVFCAVVLLAGMLSDYFLGRPAYRMRVSDLYAAEGFRGEAVLQRIAWHMKGQDVTSTMAVKEYAKATGVDISISKQWAVEGPVALRAAAEGAYRVDSPAALAAAGVSMAPLQAAVDQLRAAGKQVLCLARERQELGLIALADDSSMAARVAYSLVPNLQVFWIADALAAEKPVDPAYGVSAGAYAILYILAMLFLAMYLFEEREVA